MGDLSTRSLEIKGRIRVASSTSWRNKAEGGGREKSEQFIVPNRLPVMGLARGRDCLSDTGEAMNFEPHSKAEQTTKFKLTLIAKKAKEEPKLKFTSLMHLLNSEYLTQCFKELKAGKAAGIDQRTLESYTADEIERAIDELISRLKSYRYRPKPVRQVLIPKANGKLRPLGIPTVMDKVLQLAVAKILEVIYEPLFLDCSYGFRPKRNAHESLKALNHMVMGKKVNWIIDADIEGFFDNVEHDYLIRCLKERISDPNFLILINRFLKAGVMVTGKLEPTRKGTPQGGIVSPILANIYLHYCLDLWFKLRKRRQLKGYAEEIRYADDFIIGVQYKEEATQVLRDMETRLATAGLTLSKEKTRIIEFGRYTKDNHHKRGGGKPPTFDFLGFTHYCGKTKDGRFAMKMRTSRKKYAVAIKTQAQWLKNIRTEPIEKIWKTLALKLTGHYQYYGLSGNFISIKNYYQQTRKLTFKWMNRRSQKKSWNWQDFEEYLTRHPLPKPRITYAIYNTW